MQDLIAAKETLLKETEPMQQKLLWMSFAQYNALKTGAETDQDLRFALAQIRKHFGIAQWDEQQLLLQTVPAKHRERLWLDDGLENPSVITGSSRASLTNRGPVQEVNPEANPRRVLNHGRLPWTAG